MLANRDGQANQVLLNDGALGFSEERPFGTGGDETRSVFLADLNDDGVLDIVAVNIGEPNAVYLGRGNGRFEDGIPFGDAERSYAVVTADLDRDGDDDIVVANVAGRNAVYWNDGSARQWTVQWLGDEADNSYGVDAADLNGDGYPEIGVANSGAFNRLFLNVAAERRGNE